MNHYLWIVIVGQFAVSQLPAQEIDYSRLKLAYTLKGHEGSITAIAISPDSKTLATASYDKTVRLWDLAAGKAKATFRGHGDTVKALRFSPDGTILAAATKNKTIRLWDLAAGKEQATLKNASEKTVYACVLRFSPDGKTLVSATNDRTIRLWDLRTGKERAVLRGHRSRAYEMIFSPDGKIMASRGYYGLKIWDAAGKEIGAIKGRVSTMRFSPDAKTLISARGHRVTLWDVSGGKEPTIVKGKELPKSGTDSFSKGFLSPDGQTLATIAKDLTAINLGSDIVAFGEKRCRVILMDVNSGKERTIVERRGVKNWISGIWYSPNGKAMALWSTNEGSITLVDAATGRQHARLTVPDRGTVPPTAFAPDGKTLVTSYGSSITLWLVR